MMHFIHVPQLMKDNNRRKTITATEDELNAYITDTTSKKSKNV